MKSVLISIQPRWCELIASGKKTVEVRKTVPKLKPPFKCYIYCTHSKNGIAYCKGNDILNGKVMGEFVCNTMYYLIQAGAGICIAEEYKPFDEIELDWFRTASCLSDQEVCDYLNGKDGYAWSISDLVIYDEPKPLREFNHCGVNYHFNPPITRPPQSWCYVEGK